MKNRPVGIDDLALYVPKTYLDIESLAAIRNIESDKLKKGLGLHKMAIPDYHEDAATMAANAVAELIEKNALDPRSLGRIYLGTESALDGAKPTATYVLEMLSEKYASSHGRDCFLNCDVVDMTFACIGGVDALMNTLDWVRCKEGRVGIVVCSDFAKYELASTGEYTQGAGAVAMLVKANPRLLVVEEEVGIATVGEHDFFKPQRTFTKEQIVEEVLELINDPGIKADEVLNRLPQGYEVNGILDENDAVLTLHKDTPVFDGPYSNLAYRQRIREAYLHFRQRTKSSGNWANGQTMVNRWKRLVFHLPYAFHAKRIFSEIYKLELEASGLWKEFARENDLQEPDYDAFPSPEDYQKAYGKFLRAISKSDSYRAFVRERIEKGQRASSEVGNMYAGSIFLSLMSVLHADWEEQAPLEGKRLGFFGYGSGSKAKVFEGVVQSGWQEVVAGFRLAGKLEKRLAIDYKTYEELHRRQLKHSIKEPKGEFALETISTEENRQGARYYRWVGNDGPITDDSQGKENTANLAG